MAGIYIHIPFCKQACHYCNFHFSTLLSYKERVVTAIAKELFLRKDELGNEAIESIYFGGGTPSLLSKQELELIFNTLYQHYNLSQVKEITLEANPDDLSMSYLSHLAQTPINRLSIGIQSFDDAHLQFMNRAHSAKEAMQCVKMAQDKGLQKISIDLIYGIPGMGKELWKQNVETAINLGVQHISSYCLTIEPKTVFGQQLKKDKFELMPEEDAETQFLDLIQITEANGFEQYEISNFAKSNAYALHNTNYWRGVSYLGVGPGAHSHFPGVRMWNISNNQQYLRQIEVNILPLEKENLSLDNQFNEWVMTGLRTQWGLSLNEGKRRFGSDRMEALNESLKVYILSGKVLVNGDQIVLDKLARFLADGIASAAFIV
ncbi:MAG: radical SAM family heme chaperone HemW [bacterium]|nr:radical SAM family heme chaperone HemW [bacterium]